MLYMSQMMMLKGWHMKSIYYDIFEDLRDRIESGEFPYQSYIPSEAVLVEEYECSHNTLRKALSVLRLHGYVQPIHGKGVLVIYKPDTYARFVLGDIESFAEATARNKLSAYTTVCSFAQIVTDAPVAALTGFAVGDHLYRVERVRHMNGAALIYDINYFLVSAVPGLTPKIVEDSVYRYVEGTLGMQISTSKRTVKVEHVTHDDRRALDLLDYSMVAVVISQPFNSEGIHFETTFSRHRPDFFTFHDTAVRGY